jgi:hypothetical protein
MTSTRGIAPHATCVIIVAAAEPWPMGEQLIIVVLDCTEDFLGIAVVTPRRSGLVIFVRYGRKVKFFIYTASIEEAKLRSAISRAYYAVFHEARLFLVAKRPTLIIPETGAAHDVVKDTFLDDSNPDWITVGVKLDRLKINRRL